MSRQKVFLTINSICQDKTNSQEGGNLKTTKNTKKSVKDNKHNGSNNNNTEVIDRAVGLIRYYRAEFGDEVYRDKLILKLINCGKVGCKSCPHGPYWYRAVFNPKTRRWVFKYFGKFINKGMLKSREKGMWDRYSFYNEEARKIRNEKKLRRKEL